jgi:hypothetical protein
MTAIVRRFRGYGKFDANKGVTSVDSKAAAAATAADDAKAWSAFDNAVKQTSSQSKKKQ